MGIHEGRRQKKVSDQVKREKFYSIAFTNIYGAYAVFQILCRVCVCVCVCVCMCVFVCVCERSCTHALPLGVPLLYYQGTALALLCDYDHYSCKHHIFF